MLRGGEGRKKVGVNKKTGKVGEIRGSTGRGERGKRDYAKKYWRKNKYQSVQKRMVPEGDDKGGKALLRKTMNELQTKRIKGEG